MTSFFHRRMDGPGTFTGGGLSPQPPEDPKSTAASTLFEFFDHACQEFGQRPAFSQFGCTLSFQQIDRLSEAVAAYLQSLPGVKPGDRVAIQVPNILAYPVIAFGIIKAGMVIVNTNPLYTPRETERQLKDAEIKVWFIAETSAHIVPLLHKSLQEPTVVICDLFAIHPRPKQWLMEFYLRHKRRAVAAYPRSKYIALQKVLSRGQRLRWQRPKLSGDELVMLQYTGGSTGVLKGAMLSHRNLATNIEQVRSFIAGSFRAGQEIIIAPLPLYHIFAFTVHCGTPLLTGAHNILILDPTALGALIKELSRWPFTAITGVNTLFYSLLRADSFRRLNFSSLRFGIAGGMKLDPKVAQHWQEVTGCPLLEGFGMSELSPVASFNPPDANRIGSIGKPVPGTSMKLVDAQGADILSPDTAGELWIKGPQVMQGYWKNPQETAQHLTADGWMRSGDLATFDRDGYWFIVGRVKRMILVSGFNVYPSEIEDVIRLHPDVVDCAVLGIPHAVTGEIIKARVISKNKELKAQDIREHCRLYLTTYKLPKHVDFVESLATPPIKT